MSGHGENGRRRKRACVRMCTLDEADVCVGCGMSLTEIREWGGMSDEGRAAVENTAKRRLEEKTEKLGKLARTPEQVRPA